MRASSNANGSRSCPRTAAPVRSVKRWTASARRSTAGTATGATARSRIRIAGASRSSCRNGPIRRLFRMTIDLMRYADGIFYFRVFTAKNHWREIAVTDVEARQSRLANAALIDEADLKDRARYLAGEKAR